MIVPLLSKHLNKIGWNKIRNIYMFFSGYKHEGIWAKIGQGNVGRVEDRSIVKLLAKA